MKAEHTHNGLNHFLVVWRYSNWIYKPKAHIMLSLLYAGGTTKIYRIVGFLPDFSRFPAVGVSDNLSWLRRKRPIENPSPNFDGNPDLGENDTFLSLSGSHR